jgi:hypothetical protein
MAFPNRSVSQRSDALLGVAVVWGTIDVLAHGRWAALAPPLPRPHDAAGALALLVGIGSCLFAVGGSEALTHVAPELQPPKIINLRRTARRVALFSVLLTAGIGFVAAALVPEAVRALWYDAPLVPLPPYLAGPVWIRSLLAIAGVVASVLLLGATVTRSALSSQTLLARMSNEGLLAGDKCICVMDDPDAERVVGLLAALGGQPERAPRHQSRAILSDGMAALPLFHQFRGEGAVHAVGRDRQAFLLQRRLHGRDIAAAQIRTGQTQRS